MPTKASLDALKRKRDVQDVAKQLGLATSGTRTAITDRIINYQRVKTRKENDMAKKKRAKTKASTTAPSEEAVEKPKMGRRARKLAAAAAAEAARETVAAHVQKNARFDAGSFVVKYGRARYRASQPYQLTDLIVEALKKKRR